MLNYTLEEVQQEIYNAVNRKRQNSGKKIYGGTGYSEISEKPKYLNKNKSSDNLKKSSIQLAHNYVKGSSPYTMKKSYIDDPIV